MVHLAFLLLVGYSRRRRRRVSAAGLARTDVAFGGAGHLQELDSADHDQQRRPGPAEINTQEPVEQEQDAQCEQNSRPRQATSLATHATACETLAGLHNAHHAKVDEDERPSATDEVEAEDVTQQEQKSEKHQEHCAARQSFAGGAKAPNPFGRREPKGVRWNGPTLFGLGQPDRIDDLVDVPKCDRQSKDGFEASAKVRESKDESGVDGY